MSIQLYVLFEHATGYALFYVHEVEDIGALLPTVAKSITDSSLFASAVKLVSFSPFKSSTNALDNINAVSEGILHDDLKLFLETNVPKNQNGEVLLGIGDTRVSNTIQEETGIKCTASEAVFEIIRGVRLHFPKLIKGLTSEAEAKAQLGLGHSYCRAKVKFNVNRSDNMIIQSIALLDQLDKDVNTFSMRVKEWYSYHFPELVKIVSDNYMYCKIVRLIGNRKEMPKDIENKLEEITMDSAIASSIYDASKMSMGMDVSPIDLINIQSFCQRVLSLTEYRLSLVEYLHKRMNSVAPNLATLIGDVVGARLISHAGSLTNLAKYPASTVQILGAEKALFRALKSRGNTPKYGLIFHSTYIGRAAAANKGRISRFLANKCTIASRIDCFTDHPSTVFGEVLREQVEERMKFFETGEIPRKNVDVMKEALQQASIEQSKKAKKRKSDIEDVSSPKITKVESEPVTPITEKKKKKKKKTAELEESVTDATSVPVTPSTEKKKKKKTKTVLDESVTNGVSDPTTPSTEKKKKKKKVVLGESVTNVLSDPITPSTEKKKKKKKKADLNQSATDDLSNPVTPSNEKKKKKKKDKSVLESESYA